MIKLYISLVLLLISAGSAVANISLLQNIENAHKKEKFLDKNAVTFDIDIYFKGNNAFRGKITMLTDSTRIRMELDNGTTLVYNGKNVYQTPANEKYDRARFDIFTWSYFFLFPYKLTDPGTVWEDFGKVKLNKSSFKSGKLSFENGVGDSPDDWYIVYTDPKTSKIKYAAYIVTFSKSKAEAEENPHAIEYENYIDTDGVPLATHWNFWNWSEDKGLEEKLGYADITNLEFTSVGDDFFSKPENSKIIER